jgi:hypothetical protein
MEIILLSLLAKIGFGFIVTATLIMLAVHAFEGRTAAASESSSSHEQIDSGDFRLHHFPQVQNAKTVAEIEEPTQRAA